MMTNKQPTYLSYLLRLWREEHGGQFIWRASLETPGLDKRQAFADLAALFAFLEAQAAAGAPPDSAPAQMPE
jgi:Rps23 Pro-64 3,4-dihydroxylase Tpa1-like proline 4-hydroxylase